MWLSAMCVVMFLFSVFLCWQTERFAAVSSRIYCRELKCLCQKESKIERCTVVDSTWVKHFWNFYWEHILPAFNDYYGFVLLSFGPSLLSLSLIKWHLPYIQMQMLFCCYEGNSGLTVKVAMSLSSLAGWLAGCSAVIFACHLQLSCLLSVCWLYVSEKSLSFPHRLIWVTLPSLTVRWRRESFLSPKIQCLSEVC